MRSFTISALTRTFHRPLPGARQALLAALSLTVAAAAQAQSFCASDGQPRPVRLMERFINADCAACWTDPATLRPAADTVALDWVLPGGQGDDAPLSAVASRDGLARLDALRQAPPEQSSVSVRRALGLPNAALRVAHGLPVNNYLGASIELKPVPPAARREAPWSAWLALVETLPAGTEGSPTERNLVRNLLRADWNGALPRSTEPDAVDRFFDARSMRLPDGANPERLRVVGWVEDSRGHLLAAAQSRCVVP